MVPLARFRRPVKVSDSSQTWLRRRIAAHRGGDQPRKQGGQMEPVIEITAGRGEVASRMIAPFDRAIAPPTYAHHERLFSRRSATGPAAVALAPAASPTKLPETNPTTRGFAPGQGLHLFVLARPRRRAGRVSMTRPLQHRHDRSGRCRPCGTNVAIANGMACRATTCRGSAG